jgi:hypothetical protein
MYREAGISSTDRAVVEATARQLDYSGESVVDLWADTRLCVARVHHRFDPPEAAIREAVGTPAGILHGRVFEDPPRVGERVVAPATPRCLQLYRRAGIRGFADLDGQFNLVVHDSTEETLLVVNDRLASQPLFYRTSSGALWFGTQVRGVLALSDRVPHLDLSSLRQFLVFQTILGEGTFVEGVRTLPPAGVLEVRGGKVTTTRYWHLRYCEDTGLSEGHHAERLADSLGRAIRQGVGDARGAAVLLSGGLDSRALVAAASPMPAYTLGDWENAEVHIARRIARRRGFDVTFVQRPPSFYPDLVDLGTSLGDGAYRFDNAHFARLRGALPSATTTLVNGYGFDLLLKGDTVPSRRLHLRGWPLNRHSVMEIPERLRTEDLVDVVLESMGNCLWRHPATIQLVPSHTRAGMIDDIRALVAGLLERAADCAPTQVQRCEYVRMNMLATRFGAYLNVLSIRHFFRDCTISLRNGILEEHLTIPPRFRLDARVYKRALAILDPGMCRIPDANTGFRPDMHYLTEHVLGRARRLLGGHVDSPAGPAPDPTYTQGSWPNMGELIRQRPVLIARIAETIADDSAIPGDVFDVPYLKGLLADHLERRVEATWPLLVVLTVGTWIRANLARRGSTVGR